MSSISFQIFSSPETNDHEVRIFIDGNNLLGDDYLGLDPPAFFKQQHFLKAGKLMIGRCNCGCEGCSDYHVTVKVNNEIVHWTDHKGLNLDFRKEDFEKSVTAASTDYSWEDTNRRVERLVTEILKNTLTTDSYSFDWASARIKEDVITLSYTNNGDQQLFELPWDKQSVESGIANSIHFCKSKFGRLI